MWILNGVIKGSVAFALLPLRSLVLGKAATVPRGCSSSPMEKYLWEGAETFCQQLCEEVILDVDLPAPLKSSYD